MSPVGTLLRGMRLAKKLDVSSMAGELGTTSHYLELVETGVVFPTAAQRRCWAGRLGFTDMLEFDRQWRSGWTRVTLAHRDGWIPVINHAPAGRPIDYEEYGIDSGVGFEYVPRSAAMGQLAEEILFAVIVVGDSMYPAWCEGDLAIFRPISPDQSAPDGSAVFVRFSAERSHTCTFKNLHRRPDGDFELHPENRVYPTMIVSPSQIDRMALAIERRPRFWIPRGQRRMRDQYVQEFPDE